MDAPLLAVLVGAAAFAATVAVLARRRRRGPAQSATRRGGLAARLGALLGAGTVDPTARARLREALIAADFGPLAADRVLDGMGRGAGAASPEDALVQALTAELAAGAGRLDDLPERAVLLIVGVNGAGKTTTIAKLTRYYLARGRRVVLGAGDTFRAAAAEQLAIWGERLGVRVVRQQSGADPAAVAFDTIRAAQAADATAIVDTAGRVHVDDDLMNELRKVVRVCDRARPGAPDAIWLVLDASQGQTAVEQARRFAGAVPVGGIVLTKLDGEGRGGFALRVIEELNLPVMACGVGEGADDLEPFAPAAFARALVYGRG